MYKGKKISVAIATYNGEAFLSQQLDSILNQTVVPDEILISDDGSLDQTVRIAKQYIENHKDLPGIVVRTDNPRHGIGGNFEWAIRHTTGDVIFICGQDDIWLPEKIEHVVNAFQANPGAEPLPLWPVNSILHNLTCTDNKAVHIPRERYLEPVISTVLISGPAACISRSFSEKSLPIPDGLPEDWWLQFCAVADDKAYYVDEILTRYRIHNSACHSEEMNKREHFAKIVKKIRTSNRTTRSLTQFYSAATQYLLDNGINENQNTDAFRTLTD